MIGGKTTMVFLTHSGRNLIICAGDNDVEKHRSTTVSVKRPPLHIRKPYIRQKPRLYSARFGLRDTDR